MTKYMKQKRGQGSLAQAHYLTYQGKEIDAEVLNVEKSLIKSAIIDSVKI